MVLRLALFHVMLSRALTVTPEMLANLVLLDLMERRYAASPNLHPSTIAPTVDRLCGCLCVKGDAGRPGRSGPPGAPGETGQKVNWQLHLSITYHHTKGRCQKGI